VKTNALEPFPDDAVYIAPKRLQKRWYCSRSSVDRIARRARLTPVYLGEGKNGMVRYIREEVEAYEQSRRP